MRKISVLLLAMIFAILSTQFALGYTLHYDLDSMTLVEEYPYENYCNEYYEALYYDIDNKDEEGRVIFAMGFPDDYKFDLPPGKIITKATIYYYMDDEWDSGRVGQYVAHKSSDDDNCDTCMDWDDAFEDCEIQDYDTYFGTIDAQDDTWIDLDVTDEFKFAYLNNKYFALYLKGSQSSAGKDIGLDLGGEKHSSKNPYIVIEYKNPECDPSQPCCDSEGLFLSAADSCDSGQTYSCPWGSHEGSAIGKQSYVQYCSGNSGLCIGNKVSTSAWSKVQDCKQQEMCSGGQCVYVNCFNDLDCGNGNFLGEQQCIGDDVWGLTDKDICINGGTSNSYCQTNEQQYTFKEDCGETFTDSQWSANYCESKYGNLVHERTVYNKGCSENSCINPPIETKEIEVVEDCEYGCLNNECALPTCFDDTGCGESQPIGHVFCNQDDGNLYQLKTSPICQEAGTIDAQCSDNPITQLVASCQFSCISENGVGVCDSNAPPVVTSVEASSSIVKRTESLEITCSVDDLNGLDDVAEITIHFKDSQNGEWIELETIENSATLTIDATASLDDEYHVSCFAKDIKGKVSKTVVEENIFEVVDYPTEFTIDVQDHTTKTNPAVSGDHIGFTTNLYDPDSKVKLIVCDEQGIEDSSCKNIEYCSQGLKEHGAFECLFDTSVFPSGTYSWTSFVVNDLGTVLEGNTGEFFVIDAPLNPNIKLADMLIWSHTGYYSGSSKFDFNNELTSYLESCIADTFGICMVPFTVNSNSAGFFEISEIDIEYYLKENAAPQLHLLEDIIANEGDLITITPGYFDPNGDDVVISISDPIGNDGIWQTTEFDDGTYQITVTASDGELETYAEFTLKVNELLDAGVGGTIKHGNVTMIVPAGSLPPDTFTDITISDVNEEDYVTDNNLKVVGTVYHFEPSGIIFDPPIRVEIKYDENEVEDEENLDAFLYKLIDEKDQVYKWTPLGAEVHQEENVLVFYLTHFSEYAIQEIVSDANAPEISIIFPQANTYGELNGTVIFEVSDDTDLNPQTTISIDGNPVSNNFNLLALEYGQHTVSIVAQDSFGNSASDSVTFVIEDTIAPETSVFSVDSNHWYTSDVTLQLQAEQASETYYCVDQFNTCLPVIAGESVHVSENGINFVRFYSTDGKNDETVKSVEVKIDLNNPYIEIVGVNSTNLTEPLETSVEFKDDESGVASSTCSFNGNSCENIIISEEGSYVLEYSVSDNVGNAVSGSKTIVLDSLKPVTTVLPDKEWLHPSENTIELSCYDSGSGCEMITYSHSYDEMGSFGYGLDLEFDLSYEEGELTKHELSYSSVDLFGSKENSKEKIFWIDDVAPDVVIHGIKDVDGEVDAIMIDYEASDVGSGVQTVTVILNGEETQETIFDNTELIGDNIVEITVVDGVGNSATESFSFTITFSCENIECDNYCDGYTYFSDGECSEQTGQCEYSQVNENSIECSDPICVYDTDCPATSWLGNDYCQNEDLVDELVSYECVNPNTLQSECIATSQVMVKQECEFGCENGACIADLCSDVVCNDYCDGSSFYSSGTCNNGNCQYNVVEDNSEQCYCKEPEKIWESIATMDMECQGLAGACLGPKKLQNQKAMTVEFEKNILVDSVTATVYSLYIEEFELTIINENNVAFTGVNNWKQGTYTDIGGNYYEIRFDFDDLEFEEDMTYSFFISADHVYSEGGDWKVNAKNIESVGGNLFPFSVDGRIADCNNAKLSIPDNCLYGDCELSDLTEPVVQLPSKRELFMRSLFPRMKITCYEDHECSDSDDTKLYCKENDLFEMNTKGACAFAGTPFSYCKVQSTNEFVEECRVDCADGRCVQEQKEEHRRDSSEEQRDKHEKKERPERSSDNEQEEKRQRDKQEENQFFDQRRSRE